MRVGRNLCPIVSLLPATCKNGSASPYVLVMDEADAMEIWRNHITQQVG